MGKTTPKCLCPIKADYIYDGKIMDVATPRCGKKAGIVLNSPDTTLHGWPICLEHWKFFLMSGFRAKRVEGKFSVLPSVILPE